MITKHFNLIRLASWLSIFLIPFISLPVLPSTYRPVSLFFLLLPALGFFSNRDIIKIKQDYFILGFFLYMMLHGLIFALFASYFDYFSFFKEIIVIVTGLIIYFGLRFIFDMYGINWFAAVSNTSYKILLIIGFAEVLAILGAIPFTLKETMNMFLSGKAHSRIQFTTMEAAWGSRVFVFAFVIYLFSSKDQPIKRIIYVFAGAFLLLFSFSVSVFAFLILALAIYFIYRYKLKGLVYIFLILVIGYLFIPLLLGLFLDAGIGGYYLNRVAALFEGDFYQVSDMFLYDQSIFIRIGYPILSFYIYLDHLTGIGIGQYGRYFNDYLIEFYGAGVLNFPEVFENIYNDEGDARSLFFKTLVDTSILGLMLLLITIYMSFKNRDINSFDSFKVFFIILAMSSSLTIGTWAYLYFWIGLAILPAKEKGQT